MKFSILTEHLDNNTVHDEGHNFDRTLKEFLMKFTNLTGHLEDS